MILNFVMHFMQLYFISFDFFLKDLKIIRATLELFFSKILFIMFNVISYYSQSYGQENSLRQNKLLYTCTCILDLKYICQTNTCIAMVFIHSLFYYHIEFVSYLQKYFYHVCIIVM